MTSKKYTYNSKATNGRERVNLWQLNKTVKALEKKIQVLSRHATHQNGLNAQQVLLNESFHDRIAELEIARWRKPFYAVKGAFRRLVHFAMGK